jgi:glycosyltransferase involved in cell wall biosynthesis
VQDYGWAYVWRRARRRFTGRAGKSTVCRPLREDGANMSSAETHGPSYPAAGSAGQAEQTAGTTTASKTLDTRECLSDATFRCRILLVEDGVPNANLGSGYPRARAILEALTELGCEVTLYALIEPPRYDAAAPSDKLVSIEVISADGARGLESLLETRRNYYSVIVASRPHNMEVLADIIRRHREWFTRVQIVYDAEALFALRRIALRKLRGKQMSQRTVDKMICKELRPATAADVVTCVSDKDRDLVQSYGIGKVVVLGHSIAPAPTLSSFRDRKHLLFVGSLCDEMGPNADSLRWFFETVYPLLRKELPVGTEVMIVGAGGERLFADCFRVEGRFLGIVEDLAPLYNAARVFIAPTRFAAGLPHKVHESAAYGVPVVTTSLIASQLGWSHGEELLVGDSPVAFGEACASLYRSPALWQHLRTRALERIHTDCSPLAFRETLKDVLGLPR